MKWSQRETKVCFLDFFFLTGRGRLLINFSLCLFSLTYPYVLSIYLLNSHCDPYCVVGTGNMMQEQKQMWSAPPTPASWSSLGRQRGELNNPRTTCKLVSGVSRERCIVLSKLMVGDLIKGGKAEWWIQKWMVMETKGGSEGLSEMKNYVVGRELQAEGTACAKVWQWE